MSYASSTTRTFGTPAIVPAPVRPLAVAGRGGCARRSVGSRSWTGAGRRRVGLAMRPAVPALEHLVSNRWDVLAAPAAAAVARAAGRAVAAVAMPAVAGPIPAR